MNPFFSKKEIQELKVRHAAEVDQLKHTLAERDWGFQMAQETSATALSKEKARHAAEIRKTREEMAKATQAWKAYCDKLQKEHGEYSRSKLLEERERTKKITGLENTLAKRKKELAGYKLRLGNALKTLDGKKEQVAKLRTELSALSSEAHQDP